MEIVIIGTGNAATVLGHRLKAAGHKIIQVFGRDSSAASKLAYELGTESTSYWNIVNKNAGIYILAVSDIAISEVIHELQLPHKIIVHTAASVSKDILQTASEHYGVFYPLQSLNKNASYGPEIPIIIDAGDEETLSLLNSLAGSISDKVIEADDSERLKLHLAAVICNNFVNHLYRLAEEFCRDENLDFALLLPLIKETASRIENNTPEKLQTGPAIRNDQETIKKHLDLLKKYPRLEKFYTLFTESIANDR